ncbi:MAG TPA: Cpe/LpqF family protein [Enteractinococcus sp.]
MKLSQPRTLLLTLFTAATLSLTGCVADPDVADVLPDQGAAPTHVAEVTFPDSEVAQTSEWVVEEINGVRAINKQDWYPRVSPQLSEDIPVDSLVGTLNSQLRPSLPFVPSDYKEPEPNYGITRLTPDLTAQPVDLHIQVDDTGLISALWYETIESDASETTNEPTDDGEDTPSAGLGQ